MDTPRNTSTQPANPMAIIAMIGESLRQLEGRIKVIESKLAGSPEKNKVTPHKSPSERILGHIIRAGSEGLTKTQITLKTQGMHREVRDLTLDKLVSSNQIKVTMVESRRGMAYELYTLNNG